MGRDQETQQDQAATGQAGQASDGGRKTGGRASGKRKAARGRGTDHVEVEWQFEAEDLERAGEWLEGSTHAGLVAVAGSTEEIQDTYLDTDDWRLYAAGYALRVRREGGGESEATLKSLATAAGGPLRRREISEPVKGSGVEALADARGPVGERLRLLLGDREVRSLFEIRTRRRAFDLSPVEDDPSTGDGSPGEDDPGEEIVEDASGNIRRGGDGGSPKLGEVALDDTEILLGEGEEQARLRRIEVEVDDADAAGAEGFVGEMRKALDLRPARISKFEAGLFAAGLSPDGDRETGPVEVDGAMSAGEAAFAVLRRHFAAMREHEPGTRLGEDPEELHDMRVATRRLRAAMKLFQGALPERAGWLREELRYFAGALGEVRDLDVQMEQLGLWTAESDEEGRESLKKLTAALEKQRGEARERMLDALNSGRYERLVSSFSEMLRRGSGRAPEDGPEGDLAGEPVLEVAPGLVSEVHRKWRKAAGRVSEGSPEEEYHDLRIKGKRLRYALESVSGLYSGATEIIKPLKSLQDRLGRHQDAVVAVDRLRVLGADSSLRLPRMTIFTMGALAERYDQEAAGIRAGLAATKEFRALGKGKQWKDLEKVMEKRRPKTKADGKGKAAKKKR